MILPLFPTLVEGASNTEATEEPITSEDTNSFEMEKNRLQEDLDTLNLSF